MTLILGLQRGFDLGRQLLAGAYAVWQRKPRLRMLALISLCLCAVYKLSYPTYAYRYRITVSIDVDGQLRSGSSVIECRISRKVKFLADMPTHSFESVGDAIFVDLGGGRNLVALLASGKYAQLGDYTNRIVLRHFPPSRDFETFLRSLPSLQGKWTLTSGDFPDAGEFPTFVTISNPSDAATIRTVSATQLEQTFGSGVRLQSVTIEMTSDAVTRGIEKRLPFLISQKAALQTGLGSYARYIAEYRQFIR